MYEDQNLIIANTLVSLTNRFRLVDIYSLVKSNLRSYVAVLVYHRVGTIKDRWSISVADTLEFENQLKYLQRTHKIITLGEMTRIIAEKRALPKKTAVITFDDGYKDNYTNAFPILKKLNIPATIFLTTGYIDNNDLFWWDKVGYILCNTMLKKIELEDFGDIIPPTGNNTLKSLGEIMSRFNRLPEEKKHVLIDKLVKISDVLML